MWACCYHPCGCKAVKCCLVVSGTRALLRFILHCCMAFQSDTASEIRTSLPHTRAWDCGRHNRPLRQLPCKPVEHFLLPASFNLLQNLSFLSSALLAALSPSLARLHQVMATCLPAAVSTVRSSVSSVAEALTLTGITPKLPRSPTPAPTRCVCEKATTALSPKW